MRSNKWELEELQKALDDGDIKLAKRYAEKALECVRCSRCHGSLDEGGKPYHPYFKGFVHDECTDKYPHLLSD